MGVLDVRGGRESCIYALVNNEFGKERYMGGKTRVNREKGRMSAEGIIRGMEAELRGKIKWDVQRWGKHAAKERWDRIYHILN